MKWLVCLWLGFASLALAQNAPWVSGERLTYQLSWQGVGVGRLYFSADATEGGWRLRGKLEPSGVAAVSGYGLEVDSETGNDFFTDRFSKKLTEPFKGTTRLAFERQEDAGCWANVSYPDGKKANWRSPSEQVLDDISIIYYLRVNPQARQLNFADFPGMVQGRLEPVPSANGQTGFRFARDGLLVEIWYRNDARRTPTKVIFGRDFGRLEANLVEQK